MLVDGSGADFAPAGEVYLAVAAASQKRAQQVIAGAQTLGITVADAGSRCGTGIHRHELARNVGDPRPQGAKDIHQRTHILNVGQIFDGAGLVRQKGGGNHRHGGILSAADAYLALQGIAAGYQHSFFHRVDLRLSRIHLLRRRCV